MSAVDVIRDLTSRVYSLFGGDVGEMSDADYAVWAGCATASDVRAATIGWLVGDVQSQPGYCGPVDVDEDEAPGLTDALVALNRAGMLTTDSQAGENTIGYDGAHWWSYAAVEGLADEETVEWLTTVAGYAGLAVSVDQWTDVTFREGAPFTRFGGPDDLDAFDICQPSAVAELAKCRTVLVYDPVAGRNDRLWPTLLAASEGRVAP